MSIVYLVVITPNWKLPKIAQRQKVKIVVYLRKKKLVHGNERR